MQTLDPTHAGAGLNDDGEKWKRPGGWKQPGKNESGLELGKLRGGKPQNEVKRGSPG